MTKIAAQLFDVRYGRLSLLAFDDDRTLLTVKQDHVGTGAITEHAFSYFLARMLGQPVLQVMRIPA